MNSQMLEDFLNLLPEEFKENEIFNSIMELLKKELEENAKILHLSLSSIFIADVLNFYPELSNIVIVDENTEDLINFSILTKDGLISLNIRDYDTLKGMKLSTTATNGYQKTLTLIITDQIMDLRIKSQKEENGFITEYDYDIKLYDIDGNELELDKENEKDLDFSEEFAIPLKDARAYRLNFHKHIDFLNENKIKSEQREMDLMFKDDLFRSPFKIDDLEKFIRQEQDRDVLEFIDEIPPKYSLTGKLDHFIENIKRIIGESEEVIISENLYYALSNYLLGFDRNIIYNKGKLINKLNGRFFMYFLHVENDQIIGIKQTLNEEDLKELLNNNPENKNIEGLLDFFNLGNTRH